MRVYTAETELSIEGISIGEVVTLDALEPITMKILIIGSGREQTAKTVAMLEHLEACYPQAEFVHVAADETDPEAISKLYEQDWKLLAIDEWSTVGADPDDYYGSFFRGINRTDRQRKGKGERKRSRAERWR